LLHLALEVALESAILLHAEGVVVALSELPGDLRRDRPRVRVFMSCWRFA